MQQQGAVEAVVADQHDRFAVMAVEHKAQSVRRPRGKILQGFTARKAHKLRRGEPRREQCRIGGLGIVLNCQAP